MKFLTTILLMLTSTAAIAQSEFDVETIAFWDQVNVNDLNCILPRGNPDLVYTELSEMYFGSLDKAELEHHKPKVDGCAKSAIDKLVFDSIRRFDSVTVLVKIIKSTAVNSRIVFGKCQRDFREQIVVEFNHDLTLKTQLLATFIPASDCR